MRGRYITRTIEMVCLANHSRRKRESSSNPSLSANNSMNNSSDKVSGDGGYEKGHNSTKNGTWLVFGKTTAA